PTAGEQISAFAAPADAAGAAAPSPLTLSSTMGERVRGEGAGAAPPGDGEDADGLTRNACSPTRTTAPDRSGHFPFPLICTLFTSVPAELLRSSIQYCPPSSQMRACRRDTAKSGVRSRSTGAEGRLRPTRSTSPTACCS